MTSDEQVRDLAKQLPWERPDAERREAVRSSLLVAATQAVPPSRKRWLLLGGGFAAGALAAAAIALLVLAPGERDDGLQPRAAHARVDAPSAAKLEHVVSSTETGTDEIVRVRAGVVRVAVPAIAKGDRVRMQTADAEVEATGAYEVAVVDDRLERVTVTEGTARITIRGESRPIFLATGQTWRPTVVTAELSAPAETAAKQPVAPAPPTHEPTIAPTHEPTVAPTREPPPTSREPLPPPPTAKTSDAPPVERMPAVTTLDVQPPPKRQATPTELHFQKGWALLREGKAAEAAVELGRAADAGGDDPLAADARYFQAVALVRAGQAANAERILVTFLDRAPQSLRRGRAAILLGKLLRDRGDTKSARTWFESALRDPDPAIATAAKAHLDAL